MVTFYSAIVKFVLSLHLQLSRPQTNHLISIMHGIILCEGRKNISQIRHSTDQYRDLSCITRFLKESPWCANRVQRRRLKFLLEKIQHSHAKKRDGRRIVFFIIDDTSCKKDFSTKHIEGLDFHWSHDEGKSVWSHCLVTTHVVTEGYSFAWDFCPYLSQDYCDEHQLGFKSKNDLAIEMIEAYPSSDEEIVYVLMDSWYTSKKMMDACQVKGFHMIAAVTVENQEQYWIYSYEGPLADVENVKVLLSWENEFDSNKTPFCILCTDHSLDLATILRYYHVRWSIETGYRYFKELLGFDQYQLLSYKAIQRFWVIQFLTQNFLELQRHEWSAGPQAMTLGDVVRRIRKEHFGQLVVYVYEQALAQKPLHQVPENLKLIA